MAANNDTRIDQIKARRLPSLAALSSYGTYPELSRILEQTPLRVPTLLARLRFNPTDRSHLTAHAP